jgi:hypothetical protein
LSRSYIPPTASSTGRACKKGEEASRRQQSTESPILDAPFWSENGVSCPHERNKIGTTIPKHFNHNSWFKILGKFVKRQVCPKWG